MNTRFLLLTGLVLLFGCDTVTDTGDSELQPSALEIVSVSPSDTAVVGTEITATLRLVTADGQGVEGVTITWAVASGGGTVANDTTTTDADGQITNAWTLGTEAGQQAITAAWESFSAEVGIRAVAGPLADLTVSPDTLLLDAIGDSAQVSVTGGADAYGNPVEPGEVTWSSTRSLVAEVEATGWVVATGGGTASVLATSDSVTDTVAVIVEQVATSVDVRPFADTLTLGQDTVQLMGIARDRNDQLILGARITWTSLDSTIATVDTVGVVRPAGVGEVGIVGTRDGAADTASIVVKSALAAVSLSQDTVRFNALQGTTALSAEVVDAEGQPVDGLTVTWSTADAAVATVSPDGGLVSQGVGTTRVVVTADDGVGTVRADTGEVEVTQVMASFALSPDSLGFAALYDTTAVAAQMADSNGVALQTPPAVAWSSTAAGVASVDSLGQVVSVANGAARVYAISGAFADSVTVTVAQEVAEVSLSADTVEFTALSDTATLVGIGLDANGYPLETGDTATWVSADPLVVAVDSTGTAVSADNGTTQLVATVGDVSDSTVAIVQQVAASLALSPALDSLSAFGDTAAYTAGATDANGFAISDSLITWTSSDGAIASADGAGRFLAEGNGDVLVVAANGALADTAGLSVWQAIASVALTPAVDTIFVGDSTALTVSVGDANGFEVARAYTPVFTYPTADVLASLTSQEGVRGVAVGRDSVEVTVESLAAVAVFDVAPDPAGAIAVGEDMGCVLDMDGAAYCWGDNTDGVLGIGSATPGWSATPQPVAGGWVFQKLSAGQDHVCGLENSGDILCWGLNVYGQLGNGFIDSNEHFFPHVVTGGHTFVDVEAAGWHSCGILDTGAAYCWGRNDESQLGNGGTSATGTPAAVSSGETFVQISAGETATCGRTDANQVYCWGDNQNGQFGNGTVGGSSTPVLSADAEAYTHITLGGAMHACGIRAADGKGYCWGKANWGVLGSGHLGSSVYPNPLAIDTELDFASIRAGEKNTCGLTPDGTAYCWGDASEGSVGDGDDGRRYQPSAVATASRFAALAAQGRNACGLTSDGRILCWGYATGGGRLPHASTPQATGIVAQQVSLGTATTCALADDGTGSCWGWGNPYLLGNGTRASSVTPVSLPLTGMTEIGVADSHACALTDTGDLYCWGMNSYGQVGQGSTWAATDPMPVLQDTSWTGLAVGRQHTCALENGDLWCFGENLSHQVDSTNTDAVKEPVARLTGVAQAAAGYKHTCALLDDGSTVCWGSNSWKQLGSNATDVCNGSECSPTALPVSGFTFDTVVAGFSHTCGITAADEAYCWGNNSQGALGNPAAPNESVDPVLVQGGHSWARLSLGESTSCGITTSGVAYCWGQNTDYELGNGTADNSDTPVAVAGGHTFADIDVGWDHVCAVATSGELYCWGYHGAWGRTGLGLTSWLLAPIEVDGAPTLFTDP